MSQTKAQLVGPVLGDVNYDSGTLFVDSVNNRVGIGTTSPLTTLHVGPGYGAGGVTGSGFAFEVSTTTIYGLYGPGGHIAFRPQSTNDGGEVWLGGSARGDWQFNTVQLRTSNTTQLTINSSGNVGIGTTNPSASKLQVQNGALTIFNGANGSITTSLQLYPSSVSNVDATGQRIEFRSDVVNAYIEGVRDTAAGPTMSMRLGVYGAEIIRLRQNGNVGIGTTNPIAKLDIFKSGSAAVDSLILSNELNFGTGSGNSIAWGSSTNISARINAIDDGGFGTHILFETRTTGPSTSTTERVRITSTGNVGIGTTNPGAKFAISGTTADQFASILSNPNNRVRGDYQRGFGTSHPVAIIGNNDDTTDGENGHLVLCSGDLTPTTNQYCGTLEFMAPESGKTNGNASMKSMIVGGLEGSGGSTGGLGGNIQFYTRGDNASGVAIERLRITSDGNLGIGTTNPSTKLDVNGPIRGRDYFFTELNATRDGLVSLNWVDLGPSDGEADRATAVQIGDVSGAKYAIATGTFGLNVYKHVSTGSWAGAFGARATSITDNAPVLYVNNRVGIGITNPSAELTILKTVAGGNGALLSIQNRSNAAGTKCGIMFSVDSSDAVWSDVGNGQIIMENTSGALGSQLKFRVYDGADSEAMKIAGDGSSNFRNGIAFARAGIAFDNSWDGYPGIVVFNSDGYGNTSNRTEFRIHGFSQSYSSYPGTSGADFGTNLRIDGATYFSSDSRHKTNIVDNPYGLNEILQLQPRKFNRINSQGTIEEDKGDILGFIAQEVREVIPEAVNYYPDEDTPNEIGWCRAYALSEGYILSTLVNAVKEQNVIIETLKSRIETLESQINN